MHSNYYPLNWLEDDEEPDLEPTKWYNTIWFALVKLQIGILLFSILVVLSCCNRSDEAKITYSNCELISLKIDDDAQAHLMYKDSTGVIEALSDIYKPNYVIIESDSNYVVIPYYKGHLATQQMRGTRGHTPIKIYVRPDYKIEHIQDSW